MVLGSGGSQNWDPAYGVDMGGNLDTLVFFKNGSDSLHLDHCSPLIDGGDTNYLPADQFDLDYDGDTLEMTPLDFYGKPRLMGSNADIGASEHSSSTFSYELELCSGDTLQLADTAIYQPGNYHLSFTRAGACDSLLNLRVKPGLDTGISIGHDSTYLMASDSLASYQWINCSTGQVLPGDSSRQFYPSSGGFYAVVLTHGGCRDTSACRQISFVGQALHEAPVLKLYPIPAKDRLVLEADPAWHGAGVEVRSLSGELIYEITL